MSGDPQEQPFLRVTSEGMFLSEENLIQLYLRFGALPVAVFSRPLNYQLLPVARTTIPNIDIQKRNQLHLKPKIEARIARTFQVMAPSKKHSSAKPTPKSQDNTPPNWPAFQPLLPTLDLSLSTLLDSQVIVVKKFWTGTLCKNYIAFLKGLPLSTTPGKPKKGDALRFNDRFQVNDPLFAHRLWIETGLRDLICGTQGEADGEDLMDGEQRKDFWYVFSYTGPWHGLIYFRGGEVVGLNPSIRIYRYTKGQFFDCHCNG